jgi:uncharacterized membrane protein
MDPLTANPFAVLTFIVAPAILTNASSVMALGTSNRFARAVDRARALAKELETKTDPPDELARYRFKQLGYANQRALLLVRALRAFYLSLGSFAAATLVSLVGAAFVLLRADSVREIAMIAAFVCGAVGVGGLVGGSIILVRETRLTLSIIREETAMLAKNLHLSAEPPATPP